MSLVKSLLSGCVTMKTWFEAVAVGVGRATSGTGVGCLGFVDLTFWHLLGKMTQDHFVCIRTILGSIGVFEALEGVAVAGFDGTQPGLFDWKAKTGMIKSHQEAWSSLIPPT